MSFPKQTLPIFLLALLISPSFMAFGLEPGASLSPESIPATDEFPGLDFLSALDRPTLEMVKGGDLILDVDRNNQIMRVSTFNVSQLLTGGYDTLPSYTVPITTSVVRNGEASAELPKDSTVNSKRAVTTNGSDPYYPTQIPTGTYKLDYAQGNVSIYGSGLHIDSYVYTPYKNDNNGYMANDLFVHATPYNNTNGCVGVRQDMDKVTESYNKTGGTKTITISQNTNTDISFLTARPDYTAATNQAKPNAPVAQVADCAPPPPASPQPAAPPPVAAAKAPEIKSKAPAAKAIFSAIRSISSFFKKLTR